MSGEVILIRRETFSASHVLRASSLGDEENLELFGDCSRPNGHGHNYILEVSIRSKVDSKTGLTMNISELKGVIRREVLQKVDHRHLNLDVPEFEALNPTTENLCIVIWNWLQPHLAQLLFEIKIFETEKNIAIYRGE